MTLRTPRVSDSIGLMDAITRAAGPGQRAQPRLRPRAAPSGRPCEAELVRQEKLPADLQGDHRRTQGGRRGAEIEVVQPHDHQHVLGVIASSHPGRDAEAAIEAAADAAPGWRALPLRRAGRDPAAAADLLAGPWRAAAQRRDHARPVEDRLPGRDRRGLRADRLLALQRRTSPGRSWPSSRSPTPGRLEPHRPPAARGLRLRDHPVQLHRDRRQPADRAGADGQHRGLEAVADPARSPRT